MCTYKTEVGFGFLRIRSIHLPSSEHLVLGCDTREGVVVENSSDSGFLQPFHTILL